jgi:hypothetical protein
MKDLAAILTAFALLAVLAVFMCGAFWFSALWVQHQEDREPAEEFMHPQEACQ